MNHTERHVKTRFAPSPTGQMHIGNYRTAFFAYLFAKKHKGKFVLRIEDTDKERSRQEYTDEIIDVFDRVGIHYDEKYIQSENLERHKELLNKLIDEDKAYISKEEAKDGSGVIKEIVRIKNPGKIITFHDLIRDEISIDTTDLDDFVIARNINEPLYHFAVVVDDYDEGITHVVRGDDHIANTPRQILIQEALGFDTPIYAHLPMVLSTDKSKLGKRNGAVPVINYLKKGYVPEALLNAICLCGWNPGTDQEIFTREELENTFELDRVQKGGAVFNEEKLNWVNKEHIKRIDDATFTMHVLEHLPESIKVLPNFSTELLGKIAPIIKDRINHFGEIDDMAGSGELEFYFERPGYFVENLLWKDEDGPERFRNTMRHIEHVRGVVLSIDSDTFTAEVIKEKLWDYATEEGRGSVLWPFRYALSGMDRSPDPFTLAEILGKNEVLIRLDTALEKLSEQVD